MCVPRIVWGSVEQVRSNGHIWYQNINIPYIRYDLQKYYIILYYLEFYHLYSEYIMFNSKKEIIKQ